VMGSWRWLAGPGRARLLVVPTGVQNFAKGSGMLYGTTEVVSFPERVRIGVVPPVKPCHHALFET
jgi:hypothetical protein